MNRFMSVDGRRHKKGHTDLPESIWPARFVRKLTFACPASHDKTQNGPVQFFQRMQKYIAFWVASIAFHLQRAGPRCFFMKTRNGYKLIFVKWVRNRYTGKRIYPKNGTVFAIWVKA